MTLGHICGRKLFLPSQHLWLRATRLNAGYSSKENSGDRGSGGPYPWMIDIGLSLRGLEDIGDVSEMRCTRSVPPSSQQGSSSNDNDKKGWVANAGDDLLAIDWDAHKITSADELYHTVWETFSDTTYIKVPISGEIIAIIQPDDEEELDEDTVLVRMMASCETLQQSMEQLLEEHDYQALVDNEPPGKFEVTS